MPVHAVVEKGKVVGYQWGESGKVYPTKKQAQKQAAAIFASGYRGDASVKSDRRKVAQALRAHRFAELKYKRDVQAVMAGVHHGVMTMVLREILPAPVARQDAATETPGERAKRLFDERFKKKVRDHLRQKVGPIYDTMAMTVDKKNRNAMLLIGIPVDDAASGAAAHLAVMRENNVRLITNMSDDYLDQVSDTIAENEGLRADELRDLLVERGAVSATRAGLIAVDQTLKLASALTQSRQVAAGVNRFRWSTSNDERVRPSHADLEGEVFSWDDYGQSEDGVDNEAGVDGEPDVPGHAINCRCVPIPIIDELEDEAYASSDLAAE